MYVFPRPNVGVIFVLCAFSFCSCLGTVIFCVLSIKIASDMNNLHSLSISKIGTKVLNSKSNDIGISDIWSYIDQYVLKYLYQMVQVPIRNGSVLVEFKTYTQNYHYLIMCYLMLNG